MAYLKRLGRPVAIPAVTTVSAARPRFRATTTASSRVLFAISGTAACSGVKVVVSDQVDVDEPSSFVTPRQSSTLIRGPVKMYVANCAGQRCDGDNDTQDC